TIDYIHAYALADGSSHTVDSTTAGLGATAPIAAGSAGYELPTVGGAATATGASTSPPPAVSPPPASPPPVSPPPAQPAGITVTSAGFGSTLAGGAGNDTLVS